MKDNDCIFCKIAGGDIPSTTVYEDGEFRVILDLNPAAKGHALVLPKDHYKDITEVPEDVIGRAFSLAGRVGAAMKKSLGCAGFNVVQNNGIEAGQTVFHFHIHIIPRYEGGPAMVTWKQGTSDPDEQKKLAAQISAAMQK